MGGFTVIKNTEGCGSIYCITNLINGKKYIGQTAKLYLSARWDGHKLSARNNQSGYLYNAMRKYGEENFVFKVLLYNIPIEQLNFYECLWIKKLNTKCPNGYNMTDGGEGCRRITAWNKGKPRSKETIQKIKSHYTPEVKEQMRVRVSGENNPMYGRRGENSPTYGLHRCGEDNPFYNKHHSEETKAKLSKFQQQRKQKVGMYDINTDKLLMTFDSYSEAGKYLRNHTTFTKADDSAISRCARGIYNNVYGYKWHKI